MNATMPPVEVLRVGTFTPMTGRSITFAAADLQTIAASYDPVHHPAPVVVGHPSIDAPAYGWVERLYVEGGILKAQLKETAASFVDMVKNGRFRKVSVSVFPKDATSNPKPGAFYLKHLGFLGAAAPAVPGLKPVELAADDEALEFSYAPPGRVDGLRERVKAEATAQDAVSVDRLIDAGAIPRNRKAEVLAFAGSLDGSQTLSFADGGRKETMRDWFFRFMREQPGGLFDPEKDYRPNEVYGRPEEQPDVSFSEAPTAKVDGVSVPRGFAVSTAGADMLNRVRQVEREQGISFAAALDMVIAEGRT